MENDEAKKNQKDNQTEKIQEDKMDDISGGKFDDEPVLICHFCGRKFPMDQVVMCSFGACCDECRLKGKK